MIALTVSLQVVPGQLDPFVEAIRDNAERSFHDEPGCLFFDVSQDLSDDHHFTLYELYADEAAVEAHRAAPHFKLWRAAVAEHVVPGSQVTVLARRLFHHGDQVAPVAEVSR
jgi:quinol monooxygenase YgiN